jgi:hypothetical protein
MCTPFEKERKKKRTNERKNERPGIMIFKDMWLFGAAGSGLSRRKRTR